MLAEPRVDMDSPVDWVCSLPVWVDCIRMRRATALQTCVCLVLAFCLAPFQHVHVDHDHGVQVPSLNKVEGQTNQRSCRIAPTTARNITEC